MIILGTRTVRLDQVEMPGDLRQRIGTPNVEDLEIDLGRWDRYIHDPMVRVLPDGRMLIVCGRDRFAAAYHLGRTELEVKLVECTDEEAEELEIVENLKRRREDDAGLRKAYVDLLARRQEAEAAAYGKAGGHLPDERPGRPATARGKAREEAAKRLGVSKNALEQQERRQAKKEEEAAKQLRLGAWGADDEDEQPEERLPPPVELLGTEPPAAMLTAVSDIQRLLDEADRQMRLVQATLSKLKGVALALPEGTWQRLYKEAHTLAHDVRGARPVSVCPFCKLVTGLQEVCTACATNGYIVEDQSQGVPPELLDVGARLVAQRGRFIPIDKVVPLKRVKVANEKDEAVGGGRG